jgi:hypothetical protein
MEKKMKQHKPGITLILLIFSLVLLAGCASTSATKAPEEGSVAYYEQFFVAQAEELFEKNDLYGEAQMELDYTSQGVRIYNLVVYSPDFVDASDLLKKTVLSDLRDLKEQNGPNAEMVKASNFVIFSLVNSQDSEYVYDPEGDQVLESEPLYAYGRDNTYTNTIVGQWVNPNATCQDLTLRKLQSSYRLITTCADGSAEAKVLVIRTYNNQDRLYEASGVGSGEYLLIEDDGSLGFYNLDGLMYSLAGK